MDCTIITLEAPLYNMYKELHRGKILGVLRTAVEAKCVHYKKALMQLYYEFIRKVKCGLYKEQQLKLILTL